MNSAALPVALRDVHFSRGTRKVLNGVHLEVPAGSITALLGGNGAGKTTTLNLLLGALQPEAGEVKVFGHDAWNERDAALERLAFVSENVSLYGHLSAVENLDYLLGLSGKKRPRSSLEAALAQAGLPKQAWGSRLDGYSKGMRQKVAIALAIARDAPLLLLDEPTSGLDPEATADFSRLLIGLRARGVAILMVTHDVFAAAELADAIVTLRHGQMQPAQRGADGRYNPLQLHQHEYASTPP